MISHRNLRKSFGVRLAFVLVTSSQKTLSSSTSSHIIIIDHDRAALGTFDTSRHRLIQCIVSLRLKLSWLHNRQLPSSSATVLSVPLLTRSRRWLSTFTYKTVQQITHDPQVRRHRSSCLTALQLLFGKKVTWVVSGQDVITCNPPFLITHQFRSIALIYSHHTTCGFLSKPNCLASFNLITLPVLIAGAGLLLRSSSRFRIRERFTTHRSSSIVITDDRFRHQEHWPQFDSWPSSHSVTHDCLVVSHRPVDRIILTYKTIENRSIYPVSYNFKSYDSTIRHLKSFDPNLLPRLRLSCTRIARWTSRPRTSCRVAPSLLLNFFIRFD
jgi:hypothetical protein